MKDVRHWLLFWLTVLGLSIVLTIIDPLGPSLSAFLAYFAVSLISALLVLLAWSSIGDLKKPKWLMDRTPLPLVRTLKQISQMEVSVKTGISQTKISMFERGTKLPTPEERKKIAAVVDWPPDDLHFELIE